MDKNFASFLDQTKPNAGRIYDYFLGGHLNFAVDIKAAEEILKFAPYMKDLAQLIRWFIGKGVDKALELGITDIIDFASGLPAKNHIHLNVPPGTKVIYSDIDPVTVECAQELIGDNPLVKYETCDIKTPEKLLNSKTVKDLFKNNRKVAVGFSGICYFLSDEEIQKSMKTIYDWVAPGSILFFSDGDGDTTVMKNNDASNSLLAYYKKINQPLYFDRTQQKMKELIKPWNIMEPGFQDLEKWHNLQLGVLDEVITTHGGKGGMGMYGGILIK